MQQSTLWRERKGSLASTAAITDKAATAGTSVAAAPTTVADESCARSAAAKDKSADLYYIG